MPSWKIHSYIGNQVNKTIKVNKKYFMIGNLLPDQDRYNIGNLKRNIPRTTTHFIKREDYLIGINLPDYDKMYNKYKDKFKNPVLMGYLVHLLTDYYFNNYIYNNYFMKDENGIYIGVKKSDGTIFNCDFKKSNSMKQNDFRKFNNSISVRKNNFRFCLNSNYLKEIEELKLDKKQIYAVGKYLDTSHKKIKDNENYQILSENKMNKLVEGCIKFILKYLKEKKLLNLN